MGYILWNLKNLLFYTIMQSHSNIPSQPSAHSLYHYSTVTTTTVTLTLIFKKYRTTNVYGIKHTGITSGAMDLLNSGLNVIL